MAGSLLALLTDWALHGLPDPDGFAFIRANLLVQDLFLPLGGSQTDTGALHNLAFLVAFLPLILAYTAASIAMRKVAGWERYALATALMPVAVFGLMFVFVALAGDPGDPLYSVGGPVQRVLIAVAFGWISTTGWRLLRRPVEGKQNARRTL